jgi:NADH dehydrogenase/NADH:ubiquinone oxidoreductase subunit G
MQITLDGNTFSAESGETILDAATRQGIEIPTLCYFKTDEMEPSTSCLVCLVKVSGKFVPSCATKVADGMFIESETEEVRDLRRTAFELLLSDHADDCRSCNRKGKAKCRLLQYIGKYKVRRHHFDSENDDAAKKPATILQGGNIVFDPRKCIKCGVCISVAKSYGEELGLAFFGRGFQVRIGIPFDEPIQKGLEKSAAAVVKSCPTAAMTWKSEE